MKKKLFFAAVAIVALASCSDNEFIGDNSPTTQQENAADEIQFGLNVQNTTRAGGDPLTGATAAEKLGGMFVVEGTKGSEQSNSPSTTVVFDNYLVGYKYNSAGKTEDNTNNWEYVGLESGINDRLESNTWSALHPSGSSAQVQSIKYWDYSVDQYDFIAWSTGTCEAVADAAADGKVKVTRINTGTDLSSTVTGKGGFTMTAVSANDLFQCYYTDINNVPKAKFGQPVTLTFRNMAAKVRVALYETVPGYSVKDVKFYSADANPTAPGDLGTGSSATNAVLFTMGSDKIPQSGSVLVYYPRIGTGNNTKDDYNKASVTVIPDVGTAVTTQAFGALTANYTGRETNYEVNENIYLGRTLPNATFAGKAKDSYYTAVIPNTDGKPLTLRLDYTLVSTDGSGEEIKIYGAKAVVPATYTNWLPNYAYTYIFKISDNTNGWTSQTSTDPKGLFPITFDAVVTSFIDANAEQTTITTVAAPSITTYQQGHDHANKDEYSKSQTAGKPATVKDIYVQVMDNSGATPTLKGDLQGTGDEAGKKSLLFKITKSDADYKASEAEVMDALQNRTNAYNAASPVGRNGITLTTNTYIDNTVTKIVNGVDDQEITVTAGTAAEIDIDELTTGTYAYVYCTTVPTADQVMYNVVSTTTAAGAPSSYYEVNPDNIGAPLASGSKAGANKVYFVKTTDAIGGSVTYTFKQTKVNDDVEGLCEASITSKATNYTDGNFYFDVYNRNNGAYAVKVIKIVP